MAQNNAINNRSSQLTVDPGASGDSFIQFDINTTGEFRIGVDDTDDSFRISQGSALGTNDSFTISAAGEINKPLQPAFLAFLASTATNITGDSSSAGLKFDSEVFDQGGDFNTSTGIFTAPVTGRYRFVVNITYGGLSASHTSGFCNFQTSNRSYISIQNTGVERDATTDRFSVYITGLADMDAADIFNILGIDISGGAKTVDVESGGSTDPLSWLSGNLEV